VERKASELCSVSVIALNWRDWGAIGARSGDKGLLQSSKAWSAAARAASSMGGGLSKAADPKDRSANDKKRTSKFATPSPAIAALGKESPEPAPIPTTASDAADTAAAAKPRIAFAQPSSPAPLVKATSDETNKAADAAHTESPAPAAPTEPVAAATPTEPAGPAEPAASEVTGTSAAPASDAAEAATTADDTMRGTMAVTVPDTALGRAVAKLVEVYHNSEKLAENFHVRLRERQSDRATSFVLTVTLALCFTLCGCRSLTSLCIARPSRRTLH